MLGGDTAATSALLDRFLHHSELTLIKPKFLDLPVAIRS
jgi:hypothetical protein